MTSAPFSTLLEIAGQAPLFLTPARQPFAKLPTGAVPLFSLEFHDWLYATLRTTGLSPHIALTTFGRLLRSLDADLRAQPNPAIEPANLRVATSPSGQYNVDLGPSGDVIKITGKQWTRTSDPTPDAFLRPIASQPILEPAASNTSLNQYLGKSFTLDEESATKLNHWLQMALRPDHPCPLLILTGEFRDEAAAAIRHLIDPTACPVLPMPASQKQMGEMAFYNSVLAFSIFNEITDARCNMIRGASQGNGFRLPQACSQRPPQTGTLRRPVILSAGKAPQICRNQIVIEINSCLDLPEAEVLAALFNALVVTLRNEKPEEQWMPHSIASPIHQPAAHFSASVP